MYRLSAHRAPVAPFRRRILLGIPVVLASAALLVWSVSPTSTLQIRIGEEGQLVRAIPVAPGERITYRYLHSVQKAWVDEVMEVTPNGHLVVRETAYDMYGAGLPSDLPDGAFVFDTANNRFRIVDMSRDLPVWRVRVAFTAEQTLEVRGERIRLDSLASPTTLLVIDVGSRPRIAAL